MWTQTHRANVICTWRQRLGWRLYKPHTTDGQQATRSEERGWSRFSFPVLRESLLTPWSQTSASQNGEMIHFYGLNHLACGFCYGNPSKLIFIWTQLLVPHFPTTFLSLDWFEWPKSLWFPGMCLQRHGHGRQRWKADDSLGAGQHANLPSSKWSFLRTCLAILMSIATTKPKLNTKTREPRVWLSTSCVPKSLGVVIPAGKQSKTE